jgi:peptidoglycan/LPS O-acetylase OafA/YrhL
MRGIEGLRALAACSVLAYHSWLFSSPDSKRVHIGALTSLLPGLGYGVVLFFTLSGFLLYTPFAAAILRRSPVPSVRRYLVNRALRIAPAYIVILSVVALVLRCAVRHGPGGELRTGSLSPLSLAENAFLVQGYTPRSLLTGIEPAWSLAVECVFYLVLPVLALSGLALASRESSRCRRRLAALAPPLLLLAVGVSGKLVAAQAFPSGINHGWTATWESVIERCFWCQADLFAFGMALAVLRIDIEDGARRLGRGIRALAAPVGFGVLVVAMLISHSDEVGYSFFNTLVAFAFTCLLALAVVPTSGGQTPLTLRLLEMRPLVQLGLISYSIFLWHEPLVRWLQVHRLTAAGPAALVGNTLLLLGICVMLSTVTYRWIELPALRRKRASHRRSLPAVAAENLQAAP